MRNKLLTINIVLGFLLIFNSSFAEDPIDVNEATSSERVLRIDYYYQMPDDEAFRTAYPDIQIEWVKEPYRSSEEMLADSEAAVDITFVVSADSLSQLVAQGVIAPLLPNAELESIIQTYEPVFQQALSPDGRVYGVPISVDINCYVADDARWAAAGRPPFPTDLDTFFEQVAQYAISDSNTTRGAYLEDVLCDLSVQYSVQYWPASGAVNFDTPIYRDLLRHAKRLTEEDVKLSGLYFDADSVGYRFGLNELTSDGEGNLCTPFLYPRFEQGQPSKLSVGLTICVIKANSQNKDIATLYLSSIAATSPDWLRASLSPMAEWNEVFDPIEDETLLSGLAFYQEQVPHISVYHLGIYDFAPVFSDYLSDRLTEDELIEMLNERAQENAQL